MLTRAQRSLTNCLPSGPTLSARRPALGHADVVVGILAVVCGVLLTVVLIADGGAGAQALIPLVFAVYGVIHIAVFTDFRDRGRR